MVITLVLIMSFSVLVPAVIGWVRFKRIHPTFYPFIFCLWIGSLNEGISYLTSKLQHSNAINNNVYVLVEGVLLLWQFEKWGNFLGKRGFFLFYAGLFTIAWLLDNFLISKITHFSSYYRILYSAIICLMSINYINLIIVRERKNLVRNSAFLICAGFIIFYTYKVMVETFWLYGLNNGSGFRTNVYLILAYINLLTNCIFTLAVAWIPERQRFSLPS
jgi:hypothetical protein